MIISINTLIIQNSPLKKWIILWRIAQLKKKDKLPYVWVKNTNFTYQVKVHFVMMIQSHDIRIFFKCVVWVTSPRRPFEICHY